MGQPKQTTEGVQFSQQDLQLTESISKRAQSSDPRQHTAYTEMARVIQENRRPNSVEDNIDNIIAEIISIIQEIRSNVFKIECDGIKYELGIILQNKHLIFDITKDDRKFWEAFKKKPEPTYLKLGQEGYLHGSEKNIGPDKREVEYNAAGYRNIQKYLVEFRDLLRTFHKKQT
jgi:hypothetical protein